MKLTDVHVIYYNDSKPTSNYLVYLTNPNELYRWVVCSNLEIKKGNVTWDWGHYFSNLKDAVAYLESDCISKLD